MGRLTPDMLLRRAAARNSPVAPTPRFAASVIDGMTDDTVASFIANSVAKDHGATERLAHAFEALVPESERKEQLLELGRRERRARPTSARTPASTTSGTPRPKCSPRTQTRSSSPTSTPASSRARARAQSKWKRISDDPPERVQQWLENDSPMTRQRLLDLRPASRSPSDRG
jgi:hypothetical protein